MPQPFSRTLRALDQERTLSTWVIAALLLCVLTAWVIWAFNATFPVQVSSARASLITTAPIIHIQAPERRRLTTSHLTTSRRVERGELLVAFDDTPEQMERAYTTELQRIIDEIEHPALALQRDLLEESLNQTGLTTARLEEGRAQLREVEAARDYARAELARQQELVDAGVSTPALVDEQRALSARLTQSARRWEATLSTIRGERAEQKVAIKREIAELERQLAAIKREREQLVTALQKLDYQLGLYTLHASASGELNATRAYHPGMWVERGETLARIVPDSTFEVMAHCEPDGFATRVKPGMRATLELDAFPWMEFGKVSLEVREVGSVPIEGRIRIELEIIEVPDRIRLKHGLTGQVAIELEQITPATMIMRHVMGRYQTQPGEVKVNQ